MGRKAGQASIQLQQMVGQIQGGVNPMMALSQQGADLGIVLGAPLVGSIVGIAAAIGVSLVPNLANAKTSAELLEAAFESLNSTTTSTGIGVFELSEDLRSLNEVSERLSKAKIQLGIAEAAEVTKTAMTVIKESIGDGVSFSAKEYGRLSKAIASGETIATEAIINDFNRRSAALIDLAGRFNVTGDKAIGFGQAIAGAYQALDADPSPEGIKRFTEQVVLLSGDLSKMPKKTRETIEALIETAKTAADAGQRVKVLQDTLKDPLKINNAEALKAIKQVGESLNKELALQNAKLSEGENAARRLSIALGLGLKNAESLPDSIKATISEIEQLEQKAKDIDIAEKQKENLDNLLVAYQNQAAQLELNSKAQDEYNARRRLSLDDGEKIPDNIQAEIDKLEELRIKKAEMSEQAKAEKVIEQEFKTLSSGLETGGMTELEKIQADFEAKRALIQEHTAILMQDDELTAQQKAEAAKNAAGLITDIEENAATAREKLAESEQASKLKAVSGAFGSLSSLMNTESKKLFEIGKAAAIAGAIVDGYAAIYC
jgi:hypothetical protein